MGDRAVHKFAKELYLRHKDGALDEITSLTFGQKRTWSRIERAYQAQVEHARTGAEIEPELRNVTAEQIKNSDKSKIRRIKIKVKVIKRLSFSVRSNLMSEYWNNKLEELTDLTT